MLRELQGSEAPLYRPTNHGEACRARSARSVLVLAILIATGSLAPASAQPTEPAPTPVPSETEASAEPTVGEPTAPREGLLPTTLAAEPLESDAPDAPPADEAEADLVGDETATETPEPPADAPPVEDERKVRFTGFPFVFYLPETNFGFGFGVGTSILTARPPENSRMLWFPSNLTLGGAYTLNNQVRFLLTPELYLRRGRIVVDGQTEVRIYPDRFYGLGRGTDTSYQGYTDVSVRTSTVVRFQVRPGIYVGAVIDAANTRIHSIADEDVADEPRPGSPSSEWLGTGGVPGDPRSRVVGAGPAFVLDRRDFPLMSRSGYFVRAMASGFPGGGFFTHRFARALVDVRGFIPFLNGQLVLAMQGLLSVVSRGAPFNHMASVGGPVGLRNYPDGRFRDGGQTFGQVELRFPIVWRIRGAAHVGAGTVFGRYSRDEAPRLLWATGVGLRVVLIPERRLSVRGDLVLGPEGLRVLAFVHEAF